VIPRLRSLGGTCSCCGVDRRLFLTAAASIVALPSTGAAQTSEPQIFIGKGCTLASQSERERLAGQIEPLGAVQKATLYGTSGDAGFDRLLGSYLADMAGYFSVRPGFGFYDDTGALNAFAMSNSALSGTRGTVAFGKGLLAKAMNSPARELYVIAICAHEFGHVLQFFTPYEKLLLTGWPNGRRMELHADYLSGAYIGRRSDRFSPSRLDALKAAWDSMGDTNFTDRGHHGTSDERLRCVQAGLDFTRRNPSASAEAVANAGAIYLGVPKSKG
jgi:hypothetical protein